MEDYQISKEYRRIMTEEYKLQTGFSKSRTLLSSFYVRPPHEVRWLTEQIAEIARNSLVPRSYITRYGLEKSLPEARENGQTVQIVHESVAAHTNLFMALMDRALGSIYDGTLGSPEQQTTSDGYTYREIMEAIRLHDLPENLIGDIPDNGAADGKAKAKLEKDYYSDRIYGKYLGFDYKLRDKAFKLLEESGNLSSATGRLFFCLDKASANIITLTYDSLGLSPTRSFDDPDLSGRDTDEMRACDTILSDGKRLGSEMWMVDFFRLRKINAYDDTGFATAILIMYTLMVHGKWYDWRERDYEAAKNKLI